MPKKSWDDTHFNQHEIQPHVPEYRNYGVRLAQKLSKSHKHHHPPKSVELI